MDYQVLQEGDYYQDPTINSESPTWQYGVVPISYTPPSGIQYEVLASIHIPSDSYTAVETEAERLAALLDNNQSVVSTTTNTTAEGLLKGKKVKVPNVPQCPDAYHWDYTLNECVPDDCPAGYEWNGTTCVPVVTTPPPPSPDANVPAGNITVFDTQLPGGNGDHYFPVRKARVVAKRWFKVERTYTDANGQFQFTKRFKDKVKVRLKFKNSEAIIRGMRGARFWEILNPLAKTIGVYSGNKSNITYHFDKDDHDDNRIINKYWAGATVHNAVQEYRDYAQQAGFGIGLPATGIKIIITNFASQGQGSTPMFSKRGLQQLPQEYFLTKVASAITGLFAPTVVEILKHEIDMTISYAYDGSGSYVNYHSDNLKEIAYHELTHAGHFQKLSTLWYSTFVNAELAAMASNLNSVYSPYGNGSNSSISPIIALGESWAYHMGYFMTDKRYGYNYCSPAGLQGTFYYNGGIINLSSYLTALENFNPNLSTDPFKWIPSGLYYDLIDIRNDKLASPVYLNLDDKVSGYTNQQLFNAFSSSITSLGSYKTALLNQNSNNQATNVNSIFTFYGY